MPGSVDRLGRYHRLKEKIGRSSMNVSLELRDSLRLGHRGRASCGNSAARRSHYTSLAGRLPWEHCRHVEGRFRRRVSGNDSYAVREKSAGKLLVMLRGTISRDRREPNRDKCAAGWVGLALVWLSTDLSRLLSQGPTSRSAFRLFFAYL